MYLKSAGCVANSAYPDQNATAQLQVNRLLNLKNEHSQYAVKTLSLKLELTLICTRKSLKCSLNAEMSWLKLNKPSMNILICGLKINKDK